MRKQSVNDLTVPEINEATIKFIRDICSRISQAIEQIEQVCTQQTEPKPEPYQLEKFQGIGLFSYVKTKQQQLKKKYPAFTDNQIMTILITQWQNLSNKQKLEFFNGLNLSVFGKSKKLKKLTKQSQKICESISSESSIKDFNDNIEKQVQNLSDKQKVGQVMQAKKSGIEPQEQVDRFQEVESLLRLKNYGKKNSICNTINLSVHPQSQLNQTQSQRVSQSKEQSKKQILVTHQCSNQATQEQVQTQIKKDKSQNQAQKSQHLVSNLPNPNLVTIPSQTSQPFQASLNETQKTQINSIIRNDEDEDSCNQNVVIKNQPVQDPVPMSEISSPQIFGEEPEVTFGNPKKIEEIMKTQHNYTTKNQHCLIQEKGQNSNETPFFCQSEQPIELKSELNTETKNHEAGDKQI